METPVNKEIVRERKGKVLSGVVVSDKMKDTVVVLVERYIKNTKYQKFINLKKKYKAHDKGNVCKIGDKVEIEETRPISKDKHFKVISRIESPITKQASE